MNPELIYSLSAAVVAALGAVYTAKVNRRASQQAIEAQSAIEKNRVDGEAYERAMKFNSQLSSTMQKEILRLQRELRDVRDELVRSRTSNEALTRKVDALQHTVDRMSSLLIAHDIPLPEGVS